MFIHFLLKCMIKAIFKIEIIIIMIFLLPVCRVCNLMDKRFIIILIEKIVKVSFLRILRFIMGILSKSRRCLMAVIKCSGSQVHRVNIIKRIIVGLVMLIDMYILSFSIYDTSTLS